MSDHSFTLKEAASRVLDWTLTRRSALGLMGAAVGTSALDGRLSPAALEVPLWRGLPPGSPALLPTPRSQMRGPPGRQRLGVSGVDVPTLTIHRAALPNGYAIITIPGGGYGFLNIESEGEDFALAFTARGYTVGVLEYRLPREGWQPRADVPLQDAQRAIRLLRSYATQFGFAPDQVGIIGFSAGGHLAASLATGFQEPVYSGDSAIDASDARPTFVGLLYAVTSLLGEAPLGGTRSNLLGPHASNEQILRRSPVLNIVSTTPRSFVMHAADDAIVDPSQSISWRDRCHTLQIPCELHILRAAGHGFALNLPPINPGSRWPDLFDSWIRS